MCRNYTCLPGFWKTRSHKCIPVGLMCDGNINSADGSDEANCEAYTCTEGYVKCGDLKTCVAVRVTLYSRAKAKAIFFFDLLLLKHRFSINTQPGTLHNKLQATSLSRSLSL